MLLRLHIAAVALVLALAASVNVASHPQGAVGNLPAAFAAAPTSTASGRLAAPIIYSVIMDAGSTGTRIAIYTSPKSTVDFTPLPQNDHSKVQWAVKKFPGISSIKAEEVDAYLAPLLQAASERIPAECHPATIIQLRATAGMRLIPEQDRIDIMKAARLAMRRQTKFEVDPNTSAFTISGELEGIGGWITANSLLNRLAEKDSSPQHTVDPSPQHTVDPSLDSGNNTVAFLDLGGASTQIAFETPPDQPPLVGDFALMLPHSPRRTVYTHSYLRLGAVQARGRYYAYLQKLFPKASTIPDPCAWKGSPYTGTAIHVDNILGTATTNKVNLIGTGVPRACALNIRRALLMPASPILCSQPPCAIHGVYQPSIPEHMEIHAVSNFAEMAQQMGCATESNNYIAPLQCLSNAVNERCRMSLNDAMAKYPTIKDSDELHRMCFIANFAVQIAQTAFRIPLKRKIRWSDRWEGKELGWTMGAVILDRSFSKLQSLSASALPSYAAVGPGGLRGSAENIAVPDDWLSN